MGDKKKSPDDEPIKVDADLNQESVTDAMRGENNIPRREGQKTLDGKKRAPAEES